MNLPDKDQTPHLDLGRTLKMGLYILAAFLLTFGLWIFFTPIESAAISQGRVIVDTYRKSIQHLKGGRIKDIFVKEGDYVKKGTPLIQLDDTDEKLEYNALQKEYFQSIATKARLEAILKKAQKISWPQELVENDQNPEVVEIIKREEGYFDNHNKYVTDQLNILSKVIAKELANIETARERLKHEQTQLDLAKEEEVEVKKLREENLVSKPRLLTLQREGEKLSGNIKAIQGAMEQSKREILRASAEQESIVSKSQADISSQLSELVKRLYDVEGKRAVLKETLDHSLIVSPIDGTIVNLRYHTLGGVIKPGDMIMDIVPAHDQMIVEAQVNPLDIDVVHPGLKAKVDFLPYVKQRNIPIMNGTVTVVSADVFTDEKTNHTFYKVYIEVPPSELEKASQVKLYPGMPAQVMIINEKRTPFEYFVDPIKKSFDRAFREK